MIQQLKVLVYVLVTLGIGFALARACLARELQRSLMPVLGIALVAAQTIAFLSPHLLVYNLTIVALMVLLGRRRELVAALYLFVVLTLPLVAVPLAFGGVFLLTYDIGISVGLGALLALAMTKGPRRAPTVTLDLVVLALWLLFTLAYARGTSATNVLRVALDQGVLLLLPYFVVSRAVRTAHDLRLALIALIVAGAALSTLAAFEALRAWPVYRGIWDHYGIGLGSGASVKLRGGFLRSPGPFPEPTSFALALAIVTIITVAVKSVFRSRAAHFVVMAVLSIGVLAPQSRGAWIGIGLGILAIAAYLQNWRMLGRAAMSITITVLGAGAATFVSPRLAGLIASYDDMTIATDYRSTLFARGLVEFWRHPLAGAPVEKVVGSLRDITQGEGLVDFVNSYLFVALISGFAGLTVYVLTMLVPILTLFGARSARPRAAEMQRMQAAVFASLIALMAMLGFTSLGGRTTILLVVLIALAGANTRMRP